MKQYNVTGMSCAACSARVEKEVLKVDGVTSCSVSLLTNSMGVEGSASTEAIISAVEKAGYGASEKRSETQKAGSSAPASDALEDKETPRLLKRLIVSGAFLIVLMYVSMGHTMWGWPLPSALAENHLAIGLIQLLLTGIIMVINQKFFISGAKGLFRGSPNMDTLVAMGSGAAFVYSVYALFAMTFAVQRGDAEAAHSYMHEFYFESAAMILTLITVGKTLEAMAKGKTTNALKSLMKLAPKTAVIMRDGEETEVPIESVRKGDVFVVRPGDNIPVDGVVLDGSSAINESALTGESIPVDKAAGDSVSAATVNLSGFLKCEATRVGEDTTLSQIIKMVSDAAATKAPIAKIADKVSGIFVPTVIGIALLTIIGWLTIGGESIGFALARGISVLVISCPCALGLATPVAIMVGNGVGARHGILFKTAASLEEMGRIKKIALDKTGTVTEGEPRVTDIIASDSVGAGRLLEVAYSIERLSEHPLSGAIVKYAEEKGIESLEITDFRVLPGSGLEGKLEGASVVGGNGDLIRSRMNLPIELEACADRLAEMGKTPLYFALDDAVIGLIAVADTLKKDSRAAIARLDDMGVETVMLTGDNERTANAVGREAGVKTVIAGVKPDGKEKVIRELSESGKTAMVGDGINDAPALTRADVGIAIGAGADVAIDAADVVLVKSRPSDIPRAVKLSRATLRTIHQNLFWAFIYNVIGIPLAAGLFIPLLGWEMNPMFGAAAMSLSSFCVVMNALRLNFVKLDNKKDILYNAEAEIETLAEIKVEEIKINERNIKAMKKITLKIEGMMCPHCEARVKQTLEGVDGVASAEVSHTAGTAIVTCADTISRDSLAKTVEAQGYKVIG